MAGVPVDLQEQAARDRRRYGVLLESEARGAVGSMTERDLRFARSHDWGVDARLENGRIVGLLDVSCFPDFPQSGTFYAFVSIGTRRDLLAWAGY